ncbi:MAG TPA: 16S rRNA (cytosine(1402)-N(4))-methyltransferase [Verrucomicrobia bacterium]|nr:MAG: 16S rRNA (cytosine(1402)-N(4))-methyltransferase [Lentisphaerae bacterium GWF2_57_35]HBA83516.1 16S rRNA (cytosine(1402)-N(4))-methyltransferase [Verrucomicrobiota bacterium]
MHRPVMLKETIALMQIVPQGAYLDGTLGSGGHAEAILEGLGEGGRLLAIDRDVDALTRSRERLARYGSKCLLEHGDFADMMEIAQRSGIQGVQGVLVDLGMSSDQVDTPERGFSFQQDGPLDMRMDQTRPGTAADLVNTLEEAELAHLIFRLGEEHASRRIARAIVEARQCRPIATTAELAGIVSRAKGGRRSGTHPATQTFQALRMAVNHELESIRQGLEAAVRLVTPGGRVAAISFHSTEDRLVKQLFNLHVGRWESLEAGGQRWVGEEPRFKWITRKPVTASDEELKENARARSAKLRVVERLS